MCASMEDSAMTPLLPYETGTMILRPLATPGIQPGPAFLFVAAITFACFRGILPLASQGKHCLQE